MFRIAFFLLILVFLVGGYGLYNYQSQESVRDESGQALKDNMEDEKEKAQSSKTLTVKAVSTIFLGLCTLALLGSFCLLFAGSLGALFLFPSGAFTAYYLAVYLGIRYFLHTQSHEGLFVLAWILLLLPLIPLILKPEATFEFFLQGVHLDMRH